MKQLTPAQVERMLRDMVASGCSASVKVRTRSLLFRALKRAQRDHGLAQNAAALADMPAGGTKRASRAMTLDEVDRLLASGLSVWWRAWITTAIMTGLRPGELLGLTWQNIDFTEGTLSVRQAMKKDGPGKLKTKTSHRTLEMPAAVAAALTNLLAEQVTRQLAAGEAYDSGPVFADEAGRPVRREMVRQGLVRRCKAAGIATFSPREMRHTWVTVLSDAGVDIEVIASGAGHVNSNVTRSVYRHQIADKISAAATVFNSLAPAAGSPRGGTTP